jgi:cell division septum initiation protein DivIVA
MNDRPTELVAELRWLADPNRGSAAYGPGELYNALDRAADEIERLLEENERLKRKLRVVSTALSSKSNSDGLQIT